MSNRRSRLFRAGLLGVLCCLAAAVAPAAADHSPSSLRCFGAASLDRLHPCHNPQLDRTVRPTPNNALLIGDPRPCTAVDGPVPACWFGTPPSEASRVVALVGDSHAEHWRTPLYRVAQALHWSIYMVTHGGCTFTAAMPAYAGGKVVCPEYYRGTQQWLSEHPEVSAIIASDHPGPVVRHKGELMIHAWVRGITAAWKAMPATVKHVIAIRDVPFVGVRLPCVQRAMDHGRDAGRQCAVLRRRAVHHDPEPVAARRVGPQRAQAVDLTDFICGPRKCFPVVGGALVSKDPYDHLTYAFAKSLGPYLLRGISHAVATWAPGT